MMEELMRNMMMLGFRYIATQFVMFYTVLSSH